MIVVNFKTYPQATGQNSLNIAKVCQDVSQKTGVKIIIGAQTADVYRLASQINIPVFGQHLDPVEPGRNTGKITALALKQAGAQGVFLNHSENPFSNLAELVRAIKAAQEQNLKVLVFVPNLKTAKFIDQFKPDFLALEEPGLVSGSKAMVEFPRLRQEAKRFSRAIKAVSLIGAGIKTDKDVLASLKLGIKGIAVSSGVVKANQPKKVLGEFARCFP